MASARIWVITIVALFVAFQLGMVAHSVKQRYFAREEPKPSEPGGLEGPFDAMRGRGNELSKPKPDDGLTLSKTGKIDPNEIMIPRNPVDYPLDQNGAGQPVRGHGDGIQPALEDDGDKLPPPLDYNVAQLDGKDGDSWPDDAPLKDDGPRLPLKDIDADARLPLKGDGPQPPLGDDGAQPPLKDTGALPPLKDTGAQPPLKDTGAQPPLKDTGAQPPLKDTGAQPPLGVGDRGAQPPLKDTGAQPPLGDHGAQPQPPLNDAGAQPNMNQNGVPPHFPHIKHDEAHPERTWPKGTFCHEFLTRTFQLKAPVCSPPSDPSLNSNPKQESVECFGNHNSQSMATCTLRNVVVSPQLLAGAMNDPDNPDFPGNRRAITLLSGVDTECKEMNTRSLAERMEGGDYVLKLVAGIRDEPTQDVSVCDVWINETTFLFTGHRFHVYFRFLDYYNLHKLMLDMVDSTLPHPNARIIRMSGSDNYMFPNFDQDLFPEVKFTRLDSMANVNTCFKKAVLIPKSYASPLFQCKNRVSLRPRCMACNGRGLNETGFNLFKIRVLNACSSKGRLPDKDNRLIILVSRTPYLRSSRDRLNRFERVLDNEDQLAREIRKAFPSVTVQVVHLEKLSICEQITYSHNADIYMGVHGSGLVHLWWMSDSGMAFEMEPNYEVGNPTFHMLSRLTGRNYQSDHVQGGMSSVHSDVVATVNKLKKLMASKIKR